MKKIYGILCACALSLTLAGCKDATAGVSDSKKALITVGNTNITKGDVYNVLKGNSGASTALTMTTNTLYELEGIKVDDNMKKRAEKEFQESLKSSEQKEEDFIKNLKSYDIESKEDYFEQYYYPEYKQEALNEKYVNDKKKSVFNTYNPVKGRVLEASSKEKAENALKAVQNGENFESTAKKYGDTTTYSGKEEVYITESSLPQTVFSQMTNVSKNGVISKVIEDTSSGKYYVVQVTEKDTSKFEEDAINTILETSTSLDDTALTYYLEKHKFTIYDIDVYNGIKSTNESYIVQD